MSIDPLKIKINNVEPRQPNLEDEFIQTMETSHQWTIWRKTLIMNIYNEWLTNRSHGHNQI